MSPLIQGLNYRSACDNGIKWTYNALRYLFLPISCHFRDCEALLVTGSHYSMNHVSCSSKDQNLDR